MDVQGSFHFLLFCCVTAFFLVYLIPLLYNCITGYLYPNSALQGIILVYYSILISFFQFCITGYHFSSLYLFQFCITGYLFTVFCRRDIFIPVFVAIPGLSGTLQSVTISSLSPPYLHPLRQLNNTKNIKTQIHKYTNTQIHKYNYLPLSNYFLELKNTSEHVYSDVYLILCCWLPKIPNTIHAHLVDSFHSIELICDALLGGFYDEENWGYQIFQVLPACMIRSIRGATALQLLPRHMHPTKYL